MMSLLLVCRSPYLAAAMGMTAIACRLDYAPMGIDLTNQ
jgi:hypothetical protein